MKECKIKIRIVPTEFSEKELNTRNSFWRFISERIEKESNNPERLEYNFKKKFVKELKRNLKNKFQQDLRDFERNYNIDFRSPFFDEYFYRFTKRIEQNERFYFDDFVNGVVKLQELKNNYFQENKEYQDLLTKNILANQIEFGIKNLRYASIGFDLTVEPIDKAAQLFDNNYELFRIFLDQYIPESFLSSLNSSIYDDSLPISVSFDYPSEFIENFEKRTDNNKPMPTQNRNQNQSKSKWDKAKWAWTLTNTSLVVPVILALIILYLTFNKFETIEKNRQDTYKEINEERKKLLKNYKELITVQKESYQDLIKEIKSDTIK